MDPLTALQNQISNQINQINATLDLGTISGTIKADLSSSAVSLQSLLDKLVLGQPLSDADQQQLQQNLDSSNRSIMMARAKRTETVILVIIGLGIVAAIGIIMWRHHQHKKA